MNATDFKKIVFIPAFMLCGLFAFAQTPENANELDKKYTPNTASIFNGAGKKPSESYGGNETEIKNVIKFSPTLLLRQRAMLFYERELLESFTMHVGIGKPFGSDVFQRAFFSIGSLTDFGTALTPGQVTGESTYWGSFPSLAAGAKIYFSGSTFDEAYIEFNYRWERVDYLLNPSIDGIRIEGENDLKLKMNAFNVGFGYTALSGSSNNFTHDFYCNFGFKLFKYTTFDQVIANSVTGAKEIVYKKTGEETNARIIPSLNIGYLFGFGF